MPLITPIPKPTPGLIKPKGITTPRVSEEEREAERAEREARKAREAYERELSAAREEKARLQAEAREFERQKNILGFGGVSNHDLSQEQLTEISFYLSLSPDEEAVLAASGYSYGNVPFREFSEVKAAANRIRSGDLTPTQAWREQKEATSRARQSLYRDITDARERVSAGDARRAQSEVERHAEALGVRPDQLQTVDGMDVVRDQSGEVVALEQSMTPTEKVASKWSAQLDAVTGSANEVSARLADQQTSVTPTEELTQQQRFAETTAGLVAAFSPSMGAALSAKYGAGTPYDTLAEAEQAQREVERASTGSDYYLSRDEYLDLVSPPKGFPEGARVMVDGESKSYTDWMTGVVGGTPPGYRPRVETTDDGLQVTYDFQRYESETPLITTDELGTRTETTFGEFQTSVKEKAAELGVPAVIDVSKKGGISVAFGTVGGEPSKEWEDLSTRGKQVVRRMQRSQSQEGYAEAIGLPQDKYGGYTSKTNQIFGELKDQKLKEEVASYLGMTFTSFEKVPTGEFSIKTGAPLTSQPRPLSEGSVADYGGIPLTSIPEYSIETFTGGTPEEAQRLALHSREGGKFKLRQSLLHSFKDEQPWIYAYRESIAKPISNFLGFNEYDIMLGYSPEQDALQQTVFGLPESVIGGIQDIAMVGMELSPHDPRNFQPGNTLYDRFTRGETIAQKYPAKYGSAAFNALILPFTLFISKGLGLKIAGSAVTTKTTTSLLSPIAKSTLYGTAIGGGIRGGGYTVSKIFAPVFSKYPGQYSSLIDNKTLSREFLLGAGTGAMWGYLTGKAAEVGYRTGVREATAAARQQVIDQASRSDFFSRGKSLTIEGGTTHPFKPGASIRPSRIIVGEFMDDAAWQTYMRQGHVPGDLADDVSNVLELKSSVTRVSGKGFAIGKGGAGIRVDYNSITDDLFEAARTPTRLISSDSSIQIMGDTGGYSTELIGYQQAGAGSVRGTFFLKDTAGFTRTVPFRLNIDLKSIGVNTLDDTLGTVKEGFSFTRSKPYLYTRTGTQVDYTFPFSLKKTAIMRWKELPTRYSVSTTGYDSAPFLSTTGSMDDLLTQADLNKAMFTVTDDGMGFMFSDAYGRPAPASAYTGTSSTWSWQQGDDFLTIKPTYSVSSKQGLIIENPWKPTAYVGKGVGHYSGFADDWLQSYDDALHSLNPLDTIKTSEAPLSTGRAHSTWFASYRRSLLPPAPTPPYAKSDFAAYKNTMKGIKDYWRSTPPKTDLTDYGRVLDTLSGKESSSKMAVTTSPSGKDATALLPPTTIPRQSLRAPSTGLTIQDTIRASVGSVFDEVIIQPIVATRPLTISTAATTATTLLPRMTLQPQTVTRGRVTLKEQNLLENMFKQQNLQHQNLFQESTLLQHSKQSTQLRQQTNLQQQNLFENTFNLNNLLNQQNLLSEQSVVEESMIQQPSQQQQQQQVQYQTETASLFAELPPITIPPFPFGLPKRTKRERRKKRERKTKKKKKRAYGDLILAPFADPISKLFTEAKTWRPAASPSEPVSAREWTKTLGFRVPTANMLKKKGKRKSKKRQPTWKFKGIGGIHL